MAEKYPHIFLSGTAENSLFTSTSKGGRDPRFTPRDREAHGKHIQSKLDQAWDKAKKLHDQRKAVALPTKKGVYLEFESAPGFDLKTQSLEYRPNGIRLLNIKEIPTDEESQTITKATVYVPKGKQSFFLRRVSHYLDEGKDTESGKPKNAPLIDGIENIRIAFAESLWTDDPELIPGEHPKWCEVWLKGHDPEVGANFRELAQQSDIQMQDGQLIFPERTVVLAKANLEQLGLFVAASDDLAEFRCAKENASFFLELDNFEQQEWVANLLPRLTTSSEADVAVSIFDTGANNGHPLLNPILQEADLHSYEPSWGVDDHNGHGTLMCGLAGYGNLQQAIEGDQSVIIPHCLESVKILPPVGDNEPALYGFITSQATSRVEIQAPSRKHLHCMAVTSQDGRDRGRPSSWSAAVDSLAAGVPIDVLAPGSSSPEAMSVPDEEKRLFIISAGNVQGQDEWSNYPDANLTNSVHDPAQSWNALVVGAYTEKTVLTDPDLKDHTPIAACGSLSPYSTTSLTWSKKWPTKPDIVMEGGNVVKAPDGFCSECADTSLLSLSHQPTTRQFDWINATSAATAQASWMAAQIQSMYPQAWPETVRGLIIHSADWTETMKSDFLDSDRRTDYVKLMKVCGHGVPNLQRALHCASNSLTLIAQETIQPYDRKEQGSGYRTKDMHVHELPWPKDVLESLGGTELTMRITLSYFIEPGPGEVGWRDRYRYASHAFRFDLNNTTENKEEFIRRINSAAREDGERPDTDSGSGRWTIGAIGRSRGSIHSDIWKGPAVELAACNLIGVYPVIGWWRERAWLNRWNQQARYSLVVSLHAPEVDVDIYTPVSVSIDTGIVIPT